MLRIVLLVLFVVLTTTTTTQIAFAQQESVTAEALFERGRKLLAEGKTADACVAFEESQRAAPATGTLLNLGNCFEKLGRTASAWAAFRQAIATARASNQTERENYARERVQQLEPKLARLSINLDPAAKNVELQKDGKAVSSAELGAPIPIDPGKHTITARAEGKKDWSTIVDVVAEAQSSVEIPALEDAPPTPAVAKPAPINLGSSSQEPPTSTRQSPTLFIVGLGAAGLGAVLLGVGAGFGLSANSKADDIETLSRDRGTWNSDYQSKYDDGESAATAATVFFVTGGLALAVGATLAILNWPASSSSSRTSTSALRRGTWAF